jgi:ketosteroid isomerase-like protein
LSRARIRTRELNLQPSSMTVNMQHMRGLPQDSVLEIERLHAKWLEFEIAGETTSLMALCADDIELWPPDAQPLVGRAAVLSSMARGASRIHGIEISDRRIRGSDEVAYLTANYKTTFFSGENSLLKHSSGSHLWILRKHARWLITLVGWSTW